MGFSLSAPLLLLVTVLVIWLGSITFLLFRAIANYNRLTHGTSDKTLSELLNSVLSQSENAQKEQVKMHEAIRRIEQSATKHLQNIGVVRFNPFADTGGDQSFVIALLDDDKNGVVVSSLYARTGTRWYVKKIKNGKPQDYELSKEEEEALQKAN